ncbi:thioesterase domain-containing protein, partial [Flavobacterium notoginsengisoli]|uniref:thioesterase domain-containing protein n=1 Tax=Flavobacterium notoginsengisoli TaxID=1478199 RepID=UPI0036297C8C
KKSLPEPDSSVLSTKQYVEPRNDVEMRLAAIWQDLLGVEKVGIHDNFFELGGHSLLVIKLVVRINEAFTLDININSIFEYPTISEFIVNMYTAISSKDAIMIPLQETGNQKALYLAPPGSGTINCYVELAKLLGENYPVYAFQSPGLYGKSKISTSIEEMASLFITEMQTIDPYGPYRLGGYSFGGLVAYEMALQLRSKGFDIEELIIFDSSLIDVNSIKLEERDLDQAFRDYLHEEINDMFRKEFNWSNLVLEGKSKQEQLEEVCKLSQNSNFKINEEEIRGRLEVKFNNENYSYLHKPEEKKLDVEVTLFKAMYGLIEKDDETSIIENDMEVDYGWSQFTTKEVIVHLIPATHMSLLDNNHIGQIYECLKAEVKF